MTHAKQDEHSPLGILMTPDDFQKIWRGIPESRRRLAHQNAETIIDFLRRMEATHDDAAIVLMGTQALDEYLKKILLRALQPPRGKDDPLFGTMRPLSTFAARIETCYRLGLIDITVANCLDKLKPFE